MPENRQSNRIVWGVVVGLLLAFSPLVARAQDADRARRTFHIAEAHYNNGEYEAAAQRFAESYVLSGRKHLLYNIYLAFRDAQDMLNARDALAAFVRDPAPGSDVVQLRSRLERMEELHGPARPFNARKVAEGDFGRPTRVPTERPTAEVVKPRDPDATTAVEASNPTSGATSERRDLDGTTTDDESTSPSTNHEPAKPSARAPDAEGELGPSGTATTQPHPTEAPVRRSRALLTGAIVSFVVGGVGLIGTTLAGAAALNSYAEGQNDCALTHSCPISVVNNVRSQALVADLSAGLAIAGIGLGVVLLVLNGAKSKENAARTAARAEPWVDARGGGGVLLRGAF